MNSNAKIEFGDFQTPQALADQVCARLVQEGIAPDIVLEPTCGVGSFLTAAATAFPAARLYGWDVNPEYAERAQAALNQADAGNRGTVAVRDFLKHDWTAEIAGLEGRLLVLGNFPWVTNAAVSALNGANVPVKQNFHGLNGMAARTGKSNFDISEWMLIQLVKALRERSATIAMLCKTATARKLLRFAWLNDGRVEKASLHRIDAKKHFDASVDACLLLVRTGRSGPTEAEVFDDLSAGAPSKTLGLDWLTNGLHFVIKEARGPTTKTSFKLN